MLVIRHKLHKFNILTKKWCAPLYSPNAPLHFCLSYICSESQRGLDPGRGRGRLLGRPSGLPPPVEGFGEHEGGPRQEEEEALGQTGQEALHTAQVQESPGEYHIDHSARKLNLKAFLTAFPIASTGRNALPEVFSAEQPEQYDPFAGAPGDPLLLPGSRIADDEPPSRGSHAEPNRFFVSDSHLYPRLCR